VYFIAEKIRLWVGPVKNTPFRVTTGTFLLVGFIVYFIVEFLKRAKKKEEAKAEDGAKAKDGSKTRSFIRFLWKVLGVSIILAALCSSLL